MSLDRGCSALHALERDARQGLGFFNPSGFFTDSAHADAQERVALQDVERARNRPADPVGFVSQPRDGARPRALLFFLSSAFGHRSTFSSGRIFFFSVLASVKLLPPECAG